MIILTIVLTRNFKRSAFRHVAKIIAVNSRPRYSQKIGAKNVYRRQTRAIMLLMAIFKKKEVTLLFRLWSDSPVLDLGARRKWPINSPLRRGIPHLHPLINSSRFRRPFQSVRWLVINIIEINHLSVSYFSKIFLLKRLAVGH